MIRTLASTSVHKSTEMLKVNYVLYGIVMVTSVITFKALTSFGIVIQSIIVVLDSISLLLGTLATVRCLRAEQVGCVHTLPASVACLALVTLIFVLDVIQCWSLYRILRMPTFLVSASQRVRILFAWAVPFAWINAVLLLFSDEWVVWAVPHIVIDPMVIVMANTGEFAFLFTIIVVAILGDIIAVVWLEHETVHMSILIQLFLSVAGLVVLWLGRPSPKREEALPKTTPSVVQNMPPETVKIRKKINF